MTTTPTTTEAAELARLQEQQRTLSTKIKAARRAASKAERERREVALRDLGSLLLDVVTGHLAEASFDARLRAAEQVLADRAALEALVGKVDALQGSADEEPRRTGVDTDDRAAVGGNVFADPYRAPEGGV